MSTTTLPGGITAKESAALLAALTSPPVDEGAKRRPLTPYERVVASLLRDRDHLDGCPIRDADGQLAQVEAYEDRSPAPGQVLRNQGAVKGSPVVVVRCMTCAAQRHVLSPLPAHTKVGEGLHLKALIASTLTTVEPAGLDTTL